MKGEADKLNEVQPYRPSKAEIIDRLDQVIELLARGEQPSVICQKLPEEWNACERTVRRYISQAYIKLAEAGRVRASVEPGLALARLDFIYRGAIAEGDFRCALPTVKERGELLGLYEMSPQAPADCSNGMPDFEDMSDAELCKLLITLGMPSDDSSLEEARALGVDISKAIREDAAAEAIMAETGSKESGESIPQVKA